MGNVTIGAKAGVISGIFYGLLSAISTYITLSLMKEQIIGIISSLLPSNLPISIEKIFEMALFISPIVSFLIGIIGGLILGAIYGWIYEKVPGKNFLIKGLFFSIIVWFILSVILGLGNLQYGIMYYSINLLLGLITTIVYGILLSFLYEKFISKIPK